MSTEALIDATPLEVVRAATARIDAAVDDLLIGLAELAAGGAASEREWRESLTSVERIGRRVDAARLRTIAGAEAAGAPERMGFVDTGSWVSKHTGANRPSASSDAFVAGALGVGSGSDGAGDGQLTLVGGEGCPDSGGAGDPEGAVGAVSPAGGGVPGGRERTPAGRALDAGEISAEHARVIVHALDQLPETVDAPGRVRCEVELVRLARGRTPAQLRKAARRVLEVVVAEVAAVDAHEEQVVADAETRARERSAFWIKDNQDGTMSGHFTVPWYSGAALKKVIDAMTAPRRSGRFVAAVAEPEGGRGAEAGIGGGASGAGGRGAGARGAGARGASASGAGTGSSGASGAVGSGAGESGTVESGAGESGAGASGSGSGRTTAAAGADEGSQWRADQLSWQQQRGLAFADLLQRIPTDHLSPKAAATVLVTVDLDTLSGQVSKVAGTDVGDDVSAGQVRRLACEAGIVPAVMGGASVPLDLGRQRRLHSEAQRVALALIYDECAADGCDRPLAWTETHHLRAWRDGGHTRLDEAVPLCGTHHHLIDRTDTDHRVERHDDGRVTIHFRRTVG